MSKIPFPVLAVGSIFLLMFLGCSSLVGVVLWDISHRSAWRDSVTPELYPAWMATHPEVKNLTQDQWRKLWGAGLLNPKQ